VCRVPSISRSKNFRSTKSGLGSGACSLTLLPFNPILLGSGCFSWKIWGNSIIYRLRKAACM
jgi:hypothetical protein